MLIKTALLSGAALLSFVAAPALAQDMASPAPTATQEAQTASPAPAAPGTMQIQPGSDVKGSDGTVLGKLEGVHTVSGAQQLKVRGTDGVLRGVPLGGLKPDGTGIAVAWTAGEFQASPAIEDTAPPAAATEQPAVDEPTSEKPAEEPAGEEAAPPPTSPQV